MFQSSFKLNIIPFVAVEPFDKFVPVHIVILLGLHSAHVQIGCRHCPVDKSPYPTGYLSTGQVVNGVSAALFQDNPRFPRVLTFEKAGNKVFKTILELGRGSRAAVRKQGGFQVAEPKRDLGEVGQDFLQGLQEVVGDLVGQFLGFDKILDHFPLFRFEQAEIALDNRVAEVVQKGLCPALLNLAKVGTSRHREPLRRKR